MRILVVLAAVLGLGISSNARADHVDWSQYLEQPGAKPMPVTAHDTPAIAKQQQKQTKTATKTTKTAKAAPAVKKPAKQAKSPARKKH